MEGEIGPPPEFTPTKDPETIENTDLNDTGNGMSTESNQESVPDSFKHPGINIVVNPPDTVPVHLLQRTKNLMKTHL